MFPKIWNFKIYRNLDVKSLHLMLQKDSFKVAVLLFSVPKVVQDWEITLYTSPADCDATKLLYEWTEPSRLDRNAKIVAYIITDTKQNVIDVNYTVETTDPYSQIDRIFRIPFTDLKANTSYWKKVIIIFYQTLSLIII